MEGSYLRGSSPVHSDTEEEIFNDGDEGEGRRVDGSSFKARPVSTHNIGEEFSTSERDRPKSNCDQAAGLFFVALAVVSVAFAILFAMGVFGPNQYFAAGFMGIVAIPFAGVGAITLWPSSSPYNTLGVPIPGKRPGPGYNGDGTKVSEPLIIHNPLFSNEGEKEEDEISLVPAGRRRELQPVPQVDGEEVVEIQTEPRKTGGIGAFLGRLNPFGRTQVEKED